ncbi:MAG: hypothetical protein Q9188_005995 [Gyalolechia gomerana]
MLVHSQLLPQLARLLLLAADTFLLVQPSQAEQIARRQSFVENYNEGGSQPWTRRAEQERRAVQEPIAVRKMMDNEGEMFFQDYWHFDQEADDSAASQPEPTSSKLRPKSYSHALDPADRWTDASLLLPFQAPFALHRDFDSPPSISHWARALLPQLHDRAFHCPTDTDASAKATLRAVAAGKLAPETFKTALQDTPIVPELQAVAVVCQDTLA